MDFSSNNNYKVLLNVVEFPVAPPTARPPTESTQADSLLFSSLSSPPEQPKTLEPLKKRKTNEAKKPKSKQTRHLYELDPSTIKDKVQQLKVKKAKKSKAYREQVKMLAARNVCCLGLCDGNEELLDQLKLLLARL